MEILKQSLNETKKGKQPRPAAPAAPAAAPPAPPALQESEPVVAGKPSRSRKAR
jgi:hypothetical protein